MLLAQPIRCLVLMSPYSFGIGTMYNFGSIYQISDRFYRISDRFDYRFRTGSWLMEDGWIEASESLAMLLSRDFRVSTILWCMVFLSSPFKERMNRDFHTISF